jgi:hypothetical protein
MIDDASHNFNVEMLLDSGSTSVNSRSRGRTR